MDGVREKRWAEEWSDKEEERLEEELEEALARLRTLEGIKKKLMYKAVINYIRGMLVNE